MRRSVRGRLRKLADSVYDVPWCVPPWGWPELRCAVRAVLGGAIRDGAYRDALPGALAEHLGVHHVLAVDRGRTALTIGLRAAGIGAGDDVVVPSYICRSVVEAVRAAGARPVFADVEDDLHVSVRTVRAALTERTRCVVVAHLFGNVAPVGAIERSLRGTGVDVVDDAAQSVGARLEGRPVGSFGRFGIVACGPGKALAGSAGGALATNDEALYRRAAAIPIPEERTSTVLRRHVAFWIWRRFRRWTLPVAIVLRRLFGYRPPIYAGAGAALANLDAGIALCQLAALERHAATRRRNAERIVGGLSRIGERVIADLGEDGVVTKLAVVLRESGPARADVIEWMAARGIECAGGYAAMHRADDASAPSLPNAERLYARILCVPVDRPMTVPSRLGDWPVGIHPAAAEPVG